MRDPSLQNDGDQHGARGRAAPELRFVSAPMAKLYVRMAAWLERPGAVARIALIAFALSLPAAATGLVGDDYWVDQRVGVDIWRGFDFFDPALNRAQRDGGALPWWVDLRLRQSFFRPIASLTHALDFALWPSSPAWMHVENSLLYAALICLAGALYAQLRLSAVAFGLAALFYAANGNHGMTVGWVSGRNTVLAATFGFLALLCEMKASESSRRKRTLHILALLAYGCALLSAEIGVSAAAYLLSYALTLRRGRVSDRLGQLWPYAAISIAWYIARDALGYGAEHSGFYQAPTQAPRLFLSTLISGFPIYLATQLIAPLATFAGMYRHGIWIGALLSSALLWLMRGLFVPLVRADPRARFFLLGAVLSIVPLASTMVQDRLVFFIGFGTAGLLALLICQRLGSTNHNLPRTGASILFFNHGLYLPASFIASLLSLAHTISEGIGFIANYADPEKIEMVTYVTAHEVGHQWWAHQVIGADLQGVTMLSEALAQYSALMVMEHMYGPAQVPRC
jgi:hypothetical protein